MKYEDTYIDLLTKLYDSVQSDEIMPYCDKAIILKRIASLERLLEKYSA